MSEHVTPLSLECLAEIRDVPAALRFTADVMDARDREQGDRGGRLWGASDIVQTAKYTSCGLPKWPTVEELRALRNEMSQEQGQRWLKASFVIFSALSDLLWADGYDSPGRSSDGLRRMATEAGESR